MIQSVIVRRHQDGRFFLLRLDNFGVVEAGRKSLAKWIPPAAPEGALKANRSQKCRKKSKIDRRNRGAPSRAGYRRFGICAIRIGCGPSTDTRVKPRSEVEAPVKNRVCVAEGICSKESS
jgi:hypothetical protein